MDRNIKTKLKEMFQEHIICRKAMFIPIACVSTFMLVGYAAVDKEKPVIVSSQIDLPYGEKFDSDAIDITDNQADREMIEVTANTESLDVNQLGSYQVEVTATDQFANSETKNITVNVVDQKGPKFETLGANEGYVVQVPVNGSADIASYIKAVDNVDGDVTPFIEASAPLDTTTISTQKITLKVTDSSNNVSEKTFDFLVSDVEAPVIELVQGENVTVDYKSEFKLENIANITDNLDTNVQVNVEGDVDTAKLDETQTIKITAKDASGNTSEATVNVVVKDISAPVITLSKDKVEVDMGGSVNLKDYLVSAIDNLDGDITANVSVNDVSTASAGNKTATFTVTDKAGNTGSASLTVSVKDTSLSIYGGSAVEYAKSRVGSAYVYGATGPNAFDCSGLTSWAYRQAGKSIPRTTGGQASGGTYVARGDLQPGDLVFFSQGGGRISHVGMYIGGGMMVHAGTPRTGVCYSSINIMTYVTARRY